MEELFQGPPCPPPGLTGSRWSRRGGYELDGHHGQEDKQVLLTEIKEDS